MITHQALRELAARRFPGVHAELPHLLYAWAAEDPDGELAAILADTGLTASDVLAVAEPLLSIPAAEDRQLLTRCVVGAPGGIVLGRHILLALCDTPHHRITAALIARCLDHVRLRRRLADTGQPAEGLLARHGINVPQQADVSPLLSLGRDLTALAAEEGAFDDLCDRPAELERLTDVLLRRTKANVALTGPAGVGKTALIELLARKLVAGEIAGLPAETRIYELSMGKLVAGTKYRGEFEERFEQYIEALLAAQPAILFIDELHLAFGAGRAEGAPLDFANLIKPLLARGTARVIGATTVEEYQRYIATDEALARRFQEVRLAEPDPALTFQMVRKQADGLQQHHGLSISDPVVTRAIELTTRHLPNRFQPDVSVDLLETASAAARRLGRSELTAEQLLDTLARQTGRPIATLTGADRRSLRNLTDGLKAKIIGQDHAVDKVAAKLIQHRQDLGPTDRNLGTFLFAGDTGVGKTELARAIAAEFFGNEKALLHLDMAEYSEPSSVNKLIGAPPGYIGSDKEGKLTAWLHTHGSGVILLDEIEKACREIHCLLLGLLDNGRITSPRGETLDARQCVIVLTTNAITGDLLDRGVVGFGGGANAIAPAELLARTFPREFLGRLDEIIVFDRLRPNHLRAIMKLRLDEALARLHRKNIHVACDEDRLLPHLLTHLDDSRTGARGIARILERKLLQPIALAVLNVDSDGQVQIRLTDQFYEDGTVDVQETANQPPGETHDDFAVPARTSKGIPT